MPDDDLTLALTTLLGFLSDEPLTERIAHLEYATFTYTAAEALRATEIRDGKRPCGSHPPSRKPGRPCPLQPRRSIEKVGTRPRFEFPRPHRRSQCTQGLEMNRVV